MVKEVLTFHVKISGNDEVIGKNGRVNLCHFTGYADCANFKGEILPGGVDRQLEFFGASACLSARYILAGKDIDGQNCRIFVENSAEITDGENIQTKPKIITDSKKLAFLEEAKLYGSISPSEEGITIHIFMEE
ncbi:MAG TPA: DUF3237 domain-containing protein [Lachnospiraceae bacterium]